jgi:hypothetical protein
MPSSRRFNRLRARQPCGKVGSGETVTGCRGVDDGLCHGRWPHLARNSFKPRDAAGLEESQHGLVAANASQQLLIAFVWIKGQQILGRSQHNIGRSKRFIKDGARDVRIGPAAGAEVGVEGNADATLSRPVERAEQLRPSLRAINRQRDGREIDEVIGRKRVQDVRGLGQIHQAACSRILPPMKEAAVAELVGPDQVDAGQLAFQAYNPACSDALGSPARDHLVAHGVVAERGDIVDVDAKPGKIDRRVQGIAAVAPRVQAALGLLQLDHALADAGHFGHDRIRISGGELAAEFVLDVNPDNVVKGLFGGRKAEF